MIELIHAYCFGHVSGLVVVVESMPWPWLGFGPSARWLVSIRSVQASSGSGQCSGFVRCCPGPNPVG